MFKDKVLVIKLAPIDGLAPSAIVVGEVPSLAHELGDDAVKATSLEAKAFLMSAKTAEVLRCHGNNVSSEKEPQPPSRLVANLDVHVDLGVDSALLSWGFTLHTIQLNSLT